VISGWFGFQPAKMLELPDAVSREAPKITFG
jgi:hypothetical protein